MNEIDLSDLISFREAAKEKDCKINTLRRAAKRGKLTVVKAMGRQGLVRDDKYEEWEVSQTGGRVHKKYLAKKSTKAT